MPPEIVSRVRSICRQLPESYEEPAWVGVRWRIRTRTFAHLYAPDVDRSPVYAPYASEGQELVVMTFRVPADDLLGLTAPGFPFFRAGWGQDVVVAVLGDDTDWTELAELITDSYRGMAPKFLAARLPLLPPLS